MKQFTRKQLYALMWSKPALQPAKELGISDVALGKTCKKHNVPKPSPGYWAKVHAGQVVPKPPLDEDDNGD
jgi:hypothetical protein